MSRVVGEVFDWRLRDGEGWAPASGGGVAVLCFSADSNKANGVVVRQGVVHEATDDDLILISIPGLFGPAGSGCGFERMEGNA